MRAIRLPALSIASSFGASAATWVLLQQFAVRGLVAIKFLAIGRMLGPAAIGSVSVALLAVAIAESLSDTGLAQAVIQGERRADALELGAVWTTLDGARRADSLLLVALAPLMSSQFHLDGSLVLILLAAVLPLLRGLASPAYYIVQRERGFQHIAGVEVAAAFVDCAVGLALAYCGAGAYFGADRPRRGRIAQKHADVDHHDAASAGARSCGRASAIRRFQPLDLGGQRDQSAAESVRQGDRRQAARAGATGRAIRCRRSSRRCCSPTPRSRCRSICFRRSPSIIAAMPESASRLFRRLSAGRSRSGSRLFVVGAAAVAEPLFSLVLGPAWLPAVPLFRIFVINMAIGALIAVLVSCLRAVGCRRRRCMRRHPGGRAVRDRAARDAFVGRDGHRVGDDARPRLRRGVDAVSNRQGGR